MGDAVNLIEPTKALLKDGKPLPGDVPSEDMTLGEATDKFIPSSIGVSPPTKHGHIYTQTQVIKYFWEKCLLSEITPLRMIEFFEHRQIVEQVGASKICKELSFVRSVYTKAMSWGINFPSPELAIKRPKKTNLSSK